ncbi:NAD(P)-dependent oxidoreductase [Herbiconiux sp. VKM Ac-1786]|jgi:nucleoside-diphosphate-sugar epimerase|uniref:NAD-dependent epimerase/dehydratase family protein n=1 Tax=Herbiconiux sp. VKM Ac-1786 TaxID=2783824 RepID=UPI00188B198A|nr:NAD(P)-dependent oxidoreductase [Herbiconiux sp. VKM Ac-1786]MBF4572718.1 NAD(P)-dependent oxidoreductase [Herbiconiux sp. VKM Ac-1786]
MTRVVVTGGSGKLGRAVVTHLLDSGYEVVNLDQRPGSDDRALFVQTDLTDYGQVLQCLTSVDDRYDGVDALVHLAAIPAPGLRPNSATFANNVPASYNVFAAAKAAGIDNVVWASSETVLGLPFLENPPPYFPVDEEYPVRPSTTYSLGKAVEEEMARHFTRWNPNLKLIGLRFSNVMDVEDYAAFPAFEKTPESRSWNSWGYIDARDGAQAVRLALESTLTGFEAFIIAAADTVMTTPSAELAERYFPEVPFTREVTGTETLLGIDKARRMLWFEPQHSWRDHA